MILFPGLKSFTARRHEDMNANQCLEKTGSTGVGKDWPGTEHGSAPADV